MYDKYPHTATAKKYCCEQKYGMSVYFGKTKRKLLYVKVRVLQNKKKVCERKIIANIVFRCTRIIMYCIIFLIRF